MRIHHHRTGLAALLLAASVGCNEKPGFLSVHLVDGPADFEHINLHVMRVDIHGKGGWKTLSEPDQTYDLLSLKDGVLATIVPGVGLPPGDYTQLRLVLGAGNTVTLPDQTVENVDVPSGLQTGVKFVCNIHVDEDQTKDVFIDIDAARSIFLHDTGSARYILRPVVHCIEGTSSSTTTGGTDTGTGTGTDPGAGSTAIGAITGQLAAMDIESVFPLGGVSVTAQTLDANGNPSIARTVTTRVDGTYTLDLLPLGATYYVVTQPVLGTSAYDAAASGPMSLTATAPTSVFDFTYWGPAMSGTVAGTITPTATLADADEVVALQPFDSFGETHTFVVRAVNGAVAAGVESYAMPDLPVGTYSLRAVRRTLVSGAETETAGTPVSVTVASGSTTTANLTVP